MIIQTIVKSPLNYDNGLLVFLSQRVDDIVKNLQQIYKYKIKGDANDAEQFVAFINKMYMDKNALAKSTKGFINRTGNSGSFGNYTSSLPSIHTGLQTFKLSLSYIMKDVILKLTNRAQRAFPQDILNKIYLLILDVFRKCIAYDTILPSSVDRIHELEQIALTSDCLAWKLWIILYLN